VQKMLGHKSAALTLDRYGHLFEDELDAVAERPNDARARTRAPLGFCGRPRRHRKPLTSANLVPLAGFEPANAPPGTGP